MKKKIFMSILVIIFLMSIIGGCGGSNPSSGGNSGGNTVGKQIQIYQTSGSGGVAMSDQNINGIVFAAGSLQLVSNYILFLPNSYEGITPQISAALYNNGVKQTDQVQLAVDYSPAGDSNCFGLTPTVDSTGGMDSPVNPIAPGRANLVATSGSTSENIIVYVYDSFGQLGSNSGVKLDPSTHVHVLSNNTEEAISIIFNENNNGRLIVNPAYQAAICTDAINGSDWAATFKNVQSVNTTSLASGVAKINLDQAANRNIVYVSSVPGGGYIKIMCSNYCGYSIIWEYSATGQFMQ